MKLGESGTKNGEGLKPQLITASCSNLSYIQENILFPHSPDVFEQDYYIVDKI